MSSSSLLLFPGVESISLLLSSCISAQFVIVSPAYFEGSATTLNCTFTSLYDNVFVPFSNSVTGLITLFMLLSERYVVTNLPSFNSQAYDLFIELSSINSKPSGILSVISFAKPANVPSLYILIVYVTISPFFTCTGVLG